MHVRWSSILAVVWLGCSSQEPAQSPDAGAAVDAGDASHDAAAEPDAAPATGPVVTSVAIDGSFHQVAQGDTVDVVVSGTRLGAATEVALGALAGTIVSAADAELRIRVAVPHGHPPGPLALRVTTPTGATSVAEAIAVTPYVVGPNAAADGRATYESPALLGSVPERRIQSGDILELLAGEHALVEELLIGDGATVRGAGIGTTVIDADFKPGGFRVTDAGSETPTTIGGFTGYGPSRHLIIADDDVDLIVRDVEARYAYWTVIAAPGGRDWQSPHLVEIDNVRLDNASSVGTAISVYGFPAPGSAIRNTTLRGCNYGIQVDHTTVPLEISNLTVERCGFALEAGAAHEGSLTTVVVRDSAFRNLAEGVRVQGANVRLERVVIEDAGVGAFAMGGTLTVVDSRLAGDREGILIRPVGQSIDVTLVGSDIEGDETGIRMHRLGDRGGGYLRVQSSRIRGPVGLHMTSPSTVEFRDDGLPGGSDVSTTRPATGYAFRDENGTVNGVRETTLADTTINGRSLTGQTIRGPSTAPPDFWILGGHVLRF